MNSKIGIFGILTLGVMMLLIPATSITSAAEYDKYYKENERYNNDYSYDHERYYDDYRQADDRKSYYEEPYKKGDKKDKPVIIVKNEPIPQKEKKMKEPPMVLVTKEVLFCDRIANGTNNQCFESQQQEQPLFPGPNSDRYVQNCNDEQCEDIDASTFDIKIENANVFEGSEQGTKHNLDVRQFLVTEESPDNLAFPISAACRASGFDDGYQEIFDFNEPEIVSSCIVFEGDCSGIVQYGEQKECNVKNYVVSVGNAFI